MRRQNGEGALNPHPRLSVSGICTRSLDLDGDLAFWAELGIDHVGIPVRKLEEAGWDIAVARVAATGLRVSNLIAPSPFDLTAPGTWPERRDWLGRVLDAATEIRAGCVVLTTGSPGDLQWEDAADRLRDALGELVVDADQRGTPVTLEHTNSLRSDISFVHTLRDAIDLARSIGTRVCMEVNACWLERGLGETVRAGVGMLALVQVSDLVSGTLDTPNRAVPGDGVIPLRRILGHVVGAGYPGPVDLEIIGPRIESEGYEAAVRRSVMAVSALLAELGA